MTQRFESLAGLRIGIFGKGGSGKSTVSILLARHIAALGNKVILLDADSTNVGLYRALGLSASPKSLLEFFGGSAFSGGRVTCPVDDPRRLPGAAIDLQDIGADYSASTGDGVTLLVAGKIGESGPGAGCDGPVSKIARDLTVRSGGNTTLLLIDYKAGFEDSARGALTSLDWALIVVDPSYAALQAAVEMVHMIRRIQQGARPATSHLTDRELSDFMNSLYAQAAIRGVGVILNKVPDDATERHMRKSLAKDGIFPLGTVRWDPAVAQAWLEGARVAQVQSETQVGDIIVEMADRIRCAVSIPA